MWIIIIIDAFAISLLPELFVCVLVCLYAEYLRGTLRSLDARIILGSLKCGGVQQLRIQLRTAL